MNPKQQAKEHYAILKETREFAENVFDYIWLKYQFHKVELSKEFLEGYSSRFDSAATSKVGHFTEDIGAAVFTTQHLLRNYFMHFFHFTFDERLFKSEIKVLWSHWIDERDNIFVKVIDTIAIIAEAILFCDSHKPFVINLKSATEWFMEWFEECLAKSFFRTGGWKVLNKLAGEWYALLNTCGNNKWMDNSTMTYSKYKYDDVTIRCIRQSNLFFPVHESEMKISNLEDDDHYLHRKIVYIRLKEEVENPKPFLADEAHERKLRNETSPNDIPKIVITDKTSKDVVVISTDHSSELEHEVNVESLSEFEENTSKPEEVIQIYIENSTDVFKSEKCIQNTKVILDNHLEEISESKKGMSSSEKDVCEHVCSPETDFPVSEVIPEAKTDLSNTKENADHTDCKFRVEVDLEISAANSEAEKNLSDTEEIRNHSNCTFTVETGVQVTEVIQNCELDSTNNGGEKDFKVSETIAETEKYLSNTEEIVIPSELKASAQDAEVIEELTNNSCEAASTSTCAETISDSAENICGSEKVFKNSEMIGDYQKNILKMKKDKQINVDILSLSSENKNILESKGLLLNDIETNSSSTIGGDSLFKGSTQNPNQNSLVKVSTGNSNQNIFSNSNVIEEMAKVKVKLVSLIADIHSHKHVSDKPEYFEAHKNIVLEIDSDIVKLQAEICKPKPHPDIVRALVRKGNILDESKFNLLSAENSNALTELYENRLKKLKKIVFSITTFVTGTEVSYFELMAELEDEDENFISSDIDENCERVEVYQSEYNCLYLGNLSKKQMKISDKIRKNRNVPIVPKQSVNKRKRRYKTSSDNNTKS